MAQLMLFDYESLPEDTRNVVERCTQEIKSLMKRAAEDIIAIGRHMITVRDSLPHGAFGPWLKAEFDWSRELAARFMQVAERFHNCKIYNFAPSALYLLAAPSTPESAREEALAMAERGEEVTHSTAQALVNSHKADNGPPSMSNTLNWSDDDEDEPKHESTPEPEPERKPDPPKWTKRERELKTRLEQGETVVVNIDADHTLIEWARSKGLFVLINRQTMWGNPFRMPDDGDRADVINKHGRYYLPHKTRLMKEIGTLKGKAIGCHCAPLACHGDILAQMANELE